MGGYFLAACAVCLNIFWGDSIPDGAGIEEWNYPAHIAYATDMDGKNNAVGGWSAADVAEGILTYDPTPGNRHFLSVGANDARLYGKSAKSRDLYKSILSAQIYWLAGDNRKADGSGFTYSGSWRPSLSGYGRVAISKGATVRFTFNGDVLAIGHYVIDPNHNLSGKAEVKVNGNVVRTYTLEAGAPMTEPAQALFRRDGFGPGTHTVTITNLSGITSFEWVWTGKPNGTHNYVSSILPTSSDQIIGLPNSYTAYFNEATVDAINLAGTDLPNVHFADVRSVIDRDADFQKDGAHLTQGAARKVGRFYESIIGASE